MAKSAQEKFNEYLAECQETMDAVREVTDRTKERYDGYAFAAGALGVILAEAIGELPRARRAEYRDRMFKIAEKARNEHLMNTIKAA